MTITETRIHPRTATGLRFDAMGIVTTLLGRLVEADRRYREMRDLEDRPDYLMQDIGLTRAEVLSALARPSRH